MATATEVISEVRPSTVSMRWIINAREDLIWFIGSVASSYALLLLYIKGIVPLVPMVALWAILIDAPHVFGTFSRTYFDRTERRTRARLLWGSLLFFIVGPVMVLLGAGFVFFFIAALWAYYHLVKQHYGFMVLYKKKNGDLAPVDNALDRLLLLFAFNYPFVAFITQDSEAMARVPSSLRSSVGILAAFLLAGTIILTIAWLARQVQRAALQLPLDIPKYLLLAAAIPMHWVVLLTPMPHKPIAIVAILTIYHNLQYHRLIWFHNQKYTIRTGSGPGPPSPGSPAAQRRWGGRGQPAWGGGSDRVTAITELRGSNPTPGSPAGQPGWGGTVREGVSATPDLRDKYGAAELISRRLLFYIAFGIIFGLIYQGPRQYLGYISVKSGQMGGATTDQSFPIQLGISFLWGYAFIHYYLDSKIWRIRRDPSVGKALNMN